MMVIVSVQRLSTIRKCDMIYGVGKYAYTFGTNK